MTGLLTLRIAAGGDRAELAALHAEAWRYAYRGIIPGVTLERMIARRGPHWWAGRHQSLLLEFDAQLAGYAMFGPCRGMGRRSMGEISELYVRPACHGAGFGRALFDEARRRLRARGLSGLVVWALAENTLACGFYSAMGGRDRMRRTEVLGGQRLDLIGFHWT